MKRLMALAYAGLFAAVMATTPSLAADLHPPPYKSPAPVYVAPFSWTGFYVGVNGGYGWGKADLSSPAGSFTTAPGLQPANRKLGLGSRRRHRLHLD